MNSVVRNSDNIESNENISETYYHAELKILWCDTVLCCQYRSKVFVTLIETAFQEARYSSSRKKD